MKGFLSSPTPILSSKFKKRKQGHYVIVVFVAHVVRVESKRILSNTRCLNNFEERPFFWFWKNLDEKDVLLKPSLLLCAFLFFRSKERFIFWGPSDSKKMKPILVPPPSFILKSNFVLDQIPTEADVFVLNYFIFLVWSLLSQHWFLSNVKQYWTLRFHKNPMWLLT